MALIFALENSPGADFEHRLAVAIFKRWAASCRILNNDRFPGSLLSSAAEPSSSGPSSSSSFSPSAAFSKSPAILRKKKRASVASVK